MAATGNNIRCLVPFPTLIVITSVLENGIRGRNPSQHMQQSSRVQSKTTAPPSTEDYSEIVSEDSMA
jgi:hypothetical protein